MRHTREEIPARTISPRFDCELPPDVRTELKRPKRPAILRRPVYQLSERSGILKWAAAFALVAIILAGVIGHYSQGLKQPATPQPDPVLQHSRQILEQPVHPTQPIGQPPVEQTRPIQ